MRHKCSFWIYPPLLADTFGALTHSRINAWEHQPFCNPTILARCLYIILSYILRARSVAGNLHVIVCFVF